ncbi:hypothetical protein PYW08_016021 [Mythimna loreyi]|uniref:Uncharacterized protein n=1 Tax=Mythimna loreyi TaxID=667449 RepID=A0ACC2QUX6_9NEOP|nr:hypothetical protein PYW08_016021 [Mythimna loreyi]
MSIPRSPPGGGIYAGRSESYPNLSESHEESTPQITHRCKRKSTEDMKATKSDIAEIKEQMSEILELIKSSKNEQAQNISKLSLDIAAIKADVDYHVIKSIEGTKKLIMYNEYTFCHARLVKNKGLHHWRCSACAHRNCKAKLVLDLDGKILFVHDYHNHSPPKYYFHKGIQFIKSQRGKTLILYNDHTYCYARLSKDAHHWRCTLCAHKSCRAKLVLDLNNQFVSADENHSFQFIKSQQSSKLILHKDYTYWYVRRNIKRRTTTWKCSSHNSKKCKAALELDYTNKIVDPDIEHTHPPPKLNPQLQIHQVSKRELVDTAQGVHLLQHSSVKAWTVTLEMFFNEKQVLQVTENGVAHWRCSSHNGKGCKARLVFNEKNKLTGNFMHNHPPTKKQLKAYSSRVKLEGYNIVMSQEGKPLMVINDYAYYQIKKSLKTGVGEWRCFSHNGIGCNSKVLFNKGVKFINSRYGKILALYKDFTFSYIKTFQIANGVWKGVDSCSIVKGTKVLVCAGIVNTESILLVRIQPDPATHWKLLAQDRRPHVLNEPRQFLRSLHLVLLKEDQQKMPSANQDDK